MELDLENPLSSPPHDDYYYSSLFHVESALLPSQDLFMISFRRKCIFLISNYNNNNNNSSNNPFLSYLAINYLDRFICLQKTEDWKPWTVNLVAVSCISLALKMTGTGIGTGTGIITFDPKTIQRMEMMILGALKWRMRSITPFSFIGFFISLFKLKDHSSLSLLRDRATQIIFKSQKEVCLMGWKPSIIAASSLLVASHELFPHEQIAFRESIWQSSYVDKDDLINCQGAMQEGENGDCGLSTGSPVHMFDDRRRMWSSTSSSETEKEGGEESGAMAGAKLLERQDTDTDTNRQKICRA